MLTCNVTFISHLLTVCNEREFKCEESGVCIDNHFICDVLSQCSDGSDENTPECGKTSVYTVM